MAMKNYQKMIAAGVDNDSAGYCAPQGMRNILLISAIPVSYTHLTNTKAKYMELVVELGNDTLRISNAE